MASPDAIEDLEKGREGRFENSAVIFHWRQFPRLDL
jgi:hypothetical protein